MELHISQNLTRLAAACPFPLYVVGGAVRDWLAGLKCANADVDLCAPASAEAFLSAAVRCGFTPTAVYKNTGTVKIALGGEEYEFTSFRSDGYVRGEHVPADVFFTDDILLDARRRDFRCNAIYYEVSGRKLVDPLGGAEDVRQRRLVTVAPAQKVFGEDGLRLMRLARIAAQTGFEPSQNCLYGAKLHCGLISDISAERVAAELQLILQADLRYGVDDGPYRGLQILRDIGVLKVILPEIAAGEGMFQRADFHDHDVLEHTLRCVKYAHPSVRLAALLHDAGKPYCQKNFGNFTGHEREGSAIAAQICARLRLSKKISAEAERLTALHMYDLRGDARENKVRRFIVENYDIFDKILYLKQADYSACKDDLNLAPSVKKLCAVHAKMLREGVPFSLKQLKIRGDELLRAGFPPESVGVTLNRLLFDCCIGEVLNDGERLLRRAQTMYNPNGKK